MRLFEYLYDNKNRQDIFAKELITSIPELLGYCKNGEDYCYLSQRKYENSIGVYLTKYTDTDSVGVVYNIFDIYINKPIHDSVLGKKNLSCCQKKDLEKIVIVWLKKYEKDVLRKEKIKRII